MNTSEYIEKYKIICICRRVYGDNLLKLAHAMHDGGLRMMEVTFDQSDEKCEEKTAEAIKMLCDEFGDEMRFGAGTVLNKSQADAAKAAGAQYLISPNTNLELVKYTKEIGLVSIPGAMTPSEIIAAHEAGADFVKLFPTARLGLKYIKDIKGPISNVKLIGTGGLTEENLKDYLDIGMSGAGISGRLADKKLIEEGDFAQLTSRAAKFMEIAMG